MPRKKRAVAVQPWTFACSEEVCRPKKPSYLRIAATHLGPFQYETKAEAMAQNAKTESAEDPSDISRELALEMIEGVARDFNRDQYRVPSAPRFKHVSENLMEIGRMADAFAARLEMLDDITRHEFQSAGTGGRPPQYLEPLMREADVRALPRLSTDKDSSADGSWVRRLKSLADYAKVTVDNATNRRAKAYRDVHDKGGNTNVWKESHGSPSWALVGDCIYVYELFKPGIATGTIGGPFHEFVLAVFEYATGREGNEHAKVEDWIRKLVKPVLLHRRKRAEVAALTAEWDEIVFRNPTLREEHLKRIDTILIKLDQLSREQEELWQKTFPHIRLHPASTRRKEALRKIG